MGSNKLKMKLYELASFPNSNRTHKRICASLSRHDAPLLQKMQPNVVYFPNHSIVCALLLASRNAQWNLFNRYVRFNSNRNRKKKN